MSYLEKSIKSKSEVERAGVTHHEAVLCLGNDSEIQGQNPRIKHASHFACDVFSSTEASNVIGCFGANLDVTSWADIQDIQAVETSLSGLCEAFALFKHLWNDSEIKDRCSVFFSSEPGKFD